MRERREQAIERRHHEQRQQRGERHAEDDHDTDGGTAGRARTAGHDQRHRAHDRGDRGHQDRAQAHHAGFDDGLADLPALVAQLIGEFDDQDAVLRRQPHQHHDADLTEQIERTARHPQPQQRAQHAQRHRQHDHQRVDEALELRGQHQIHHQQRQREGQQHRAAGLLEFARFALPVDLRGIGQFFAHHLVRPLDGIAEAIARRQTRGNGDRAQAIETVEAAGFGQLGDGDEVGQRDQLAVVAAHLDGRQVGRRRARGAFGLQDHVVLLAVVDEGGDATAAHHRFQGAADFGHRHAQIGGARAIDHHPHLRPGFLVVGIGGEEIRILLHAREHPVAPLRELAVFGAAQHDLERLAAAAGQAAARLRIHAHAGEHAQILAHLLHHFIGAHVALVPVLQEHDRLGGVHFLAGAETAGHARIHALHRLAFAHLLEQYLFDLLDLADRVIETCPFRPDHRREEHAAIFRRRQFARHELEQQHAGHQRHDHQRAEHPHAPDGALQQIAIAARYAVELFRHPTVQAVRLVAGMRAHQLGRHHRRQRQRDQRGDRHRRGQRHRQLSEQPPGIAFEETDRQEHRDQHRGGGDHRERHLLGAALGRDQRRLAQIRATLDVLQHHDGVVHHQADAQHQRQQREQIDREIEGVQRDERGDQAHRHGDRGNDRGAHAAQE